MRYYDYNWFNFIENASIRCISPCSIVATLATERGGAGFSTFRYSHFDAVETSYGARISRKPGPTADTEYVDEKAGSAEYYSNRRSGVHPFSQAGSALGEGSHIEHIMFATPNDDDHFMLFTADCYTGPDPGIFTKLAETRPPPVRQDKKSMTTKHMPFRGSVRHEDIVTQGTQGSIDEREEHLAASDRGVILLRKIILRAMETAQRAGCHKAFAPWNRPKRSSRSNHLALDQGESSKRTHEIPTFIDAYASRTVFLSELGAGGSRSCRV